MTTMASDTKIIPLALDESLYRLIENHAQLEGESLEDFILNRLQDSIDAWNDYVSAVSLLNGEEEEHFHVCAPVAD